MEPTSEQLEALDAFVTRENVLISAGAGTGKTSTLRMLAGSTARRGVYLAFNKSIADEARRSFPGTVMCRTAHSLAWAAARETPQGQLVLDRMQSRVPWQVTASELDITAMTLPTAVQPAHTFQASTVTRWVLDMVRAFCQSGDAELTAAHMPAIPAVASEVTAKVAVELAPKALRVWQDVSTVARFAQPTHDTYLKMWQLGGAKLPGDYVLFDEAQDANPVIAAVVAAQDVQRVYVGDEAQAIYSFNGAVDAMATFEAKHRLTLTQSWRFGQPIADAANTLLGLLNAPLRLTGNPASTSRLIDASSTPDAVLCRTNSETIAQAIDAQHVGRRVHLMGGAAQAQRFVEGAAQLIETGRSPHPDLVAFPSWAQAREYAQEDPRGRELVVLVSLVDEYGTDVLSDALRRCVPTESAADVVLTTAHKAKGREWHRVDLAQDFDLAQPLADLGDSDPSKVADARSELMLAYVAATPGRRTTRTVRDHRAPPSRTTDRMVPDRQRTPSERVQLRPQLQRTRPTHPPTRAAVTTGPTRLSGPGGTRGRYPGPRAAPSRSATSHVLPPLLPGWRLPPRAAGRSGSGSTWLPRPARGLRRNGAGMDG